MASKHVATNDRDGIEAMTGPYDRKRLLTQHKAVELSLSEEMMFSTEQGARHSLLPLPSAPQHCPRFTPSAEEFQPENSTQNEITCTANPSAVRSCWAP